VNIYPVIGTIEYMSITCCLEVK